MVQTRHLVLGLMPRGADPDTHWAAGPWCFDTEEDFFPGWEDSFVFGREPLRDPATLDRAVLMAQSLTVDSIPALGRHLLDLQRRRAEENNPVSTLLGPDEIDNRRREVTIDDVDTSSRNLLSNPAHAFDFIGTQYAPSLVSDAEGRAVVRLTPTSADASPAGEILVTVDTAAMRPESLRYDYDGEQVGIAVLGVAPLDTPLKAFSKGDYKGYEFIDFR